MPLQKILLKPGVNRENTRYTTEGGWYECDKVRFRQGTPEVIGGWQRITSSTFKGVCRSLWNWVTLGFNNLMGVGTNLKFYIENGGAYYDITPIRETATLTNPFAVVSGSTTVTVTDNSHGCGTGDFVTFSGATIGYAGGNISANDFNTEFQVTVVNANSYTIVINSVPNATDQSNSPVGGTVTARYQLNVGPAIQIPLTGWSAGSWNQSGSTWGNTTSTNVSFIQLWNQINYGEDLVFGPRGGGVYYWDASAGLSARGVLLSSLGGTVTFTNASPTVMTSSVGFTEGAALQFAATTSLPTGISANTTYYVYNVDGVTSNLVDGSGTLINTSSTGTGVYVSLIVDVPVKQNTITVSDTSRFIITFGCNDYGSVSMDPMLIRWSAQDDPYNWTPTAANQAGSVRLSHGSEIVTVVQTRQEIVVFTDSSVYSLQYLGPPYVWGSQLLGDNISITGPTAANDRYVIYNYLEKIWYYGTMERTAWSDSGLRDYPIAAIYDDVTKTGNLVNHEQGLNNNETATTVAIDAYISSSEFDIGDGHNFGFVWRMLPDLTFQNSTNSPEAVVPTLTMTLYGLSNSGSGATSSASAPVASSSTYVITEEFTGQIYTRLRGRQMIFKISSNQINTAWQIGAPRIDIRQDGRR